jgi:hypothetical protein
MTQANDFELGAQAPDPDGAVEGTIDGAAPGFDDAEDGELGPVDTGAGAPVDTSGQGDKFLTRDQLREVYDQVSLADSWHATEVSRQTYPDDPDMAKRWSGQLVFVYSAVRLGYAAEGADPVEFLQRVRQEDFIEVMQTAKGKSTAT